MTNHVGRAASPILVDDLLIVPLENQGASFLVGIDAKTGANRWKVERPLENNWTHAHYRRAQRRVGTRRCKARASLTGFDPRNGRETLGGRRRRLVTAFHRPSWPATSCWPPAAA